MHSKKLKKGKILVESFIHGISKLVLTAIYVAIINWIGFSGMRFITHVYYLRFFQMTHSMGFPCKICRMDGRGKTVPDLLQYRLAVFYGQSHLKKNWETRTKGLVSIFSWWNSCLSYLFLWTKSENFFLFMPLSWKIYAHLRKILWCFQFISSSSKFSQFSYEVINFFCYNMLKC